jgi:predicted  nucleic acid-binding Zn-ribbon protein
MESNSSSMDGSASPKHNALQKQVAEKRAEWNQERLRLNGELELSRRRLQAERAQFSTDQHQLEEDRRLLQERESALAEKERQLAEKRRQADETVQRLKREAEGLENRIRNLRDKLAGQEQENHHERSDSIDSLPKVAFPASADKIRSEPFVADGEEALEEYLKLLDSLACRLADERLRLTEQSERLAAARVQWDKEHQARVKELEGHNLRLRKQERALEERSVALQQHQIEIHQTRQSLEAWQARLTVESASWKSERERLLARLHSLESRANRLTAILGELPPDWKDGVRHGDSITIEKHRQAQTQGEYARLQQELQTLQGQRAADQQQIKELTALVERLARLLMEEAIPSSLPVAKAA